MGFVLNKIRSQRIIRKNKKICEEQNLDFSQVDKLIKKIVTWYEEEYPDVYFENPEDRNQRKKPSFELTEKERILIEKPKYKRRRIHWNSRFPHFYIDIDEEGNILDASDYILIIDEGKGISEKNVFVGTNIRDIHEPLDRWTSNNVSLYVNSENKRVEKRGQQREIIYKLIEEEFRSRAGEDYGLKRAQIFAEDFEFPAVVSTKNQEKKKILG